MEAISRGDNAGCGATGVYETRHDWYHFKRLDGELQLLRDSSGSVACAQTPHVREVQVGILL